MKVAIVKDGAVVSSGDHRALFPNTSFSAGTPPTEFLTENDAHVVSFWKEHDDQTQTLVSSEPYIDAGTVYGVMVREFTAEELAAREQTTQQQTEQGNKAARAELVQAIVVTTASGKSFDGDEVSQNRMARAIVALGGSGATGTEWKLADNTVAEVTLEELTEALRMAGAQQTAVWMA